MLVIGDVHGKINEYWKIIHKLRKVDISIQLGDFGFKKEHEWHLKNIDNLNHKILFGNHDYYPYLNEKHSLGDYYHFTLKGKTIMCIRGANSIDKNNRLESVDWFKEEELNYMQMRNCFDVYYNLKPDIVISHDGPQFIIQSLFGINNKSNTRTLLQQLFDNHKPKQWIFGHHHKPKVLEFEGCKFQCLKELEVIEI